eukprot:1875321-Rhodomonas_salina.1
MATLMPRASAAETMKRLRRELMAPPRILRPAPEQEHRSREGQLGTEGRERREREGEEGEGEKEREQEEEGGRRRAGRQRGEAIGKPARHAVWRRRTTRHFHAAELQVVMTKSESYSHSTLQHRGRMR